MKIRTIMTYHRPLLVISAILFLFILVIWLRHYEESLRFHPSDMTLEEQIEFIQRPDKDQEYAITDNEDEYAILMTVRYLGRNKEIKAVPAILQVLEQRRSRNLAAEAAWALGEIGDERAIRPLIYRINYKIGDNVNYEARQALHKFGKRAVPELISALHAKKVHQREHIIYLLGLIGDERALDPLGMILLYGEHGETDDAGNALERIGKSSYPLFVQGLDSDKVYVQIEAVSSLGGIEWPNDSQKTIYKIENLLGHSHERARAQAARALGRKRSTTSCSRLKNALLLEKDQNARNKMNWAIHVLEGCKS